MADTPALVLAALDDDAVRDALVDTLHRLAGRVAWLVDEEHKSDTRPCVAGQTGTLCWQFMDGNHIHVSVVARAPWKETPRG